MQIDLRILEILSSKVCHDLVSPVSAINNGVELIEDIGGDVVDEAMNLIGNSAKQAAHRLRLYRIAYGRGGSEASLTVKDVRQVVTHYFESTKMKISWPDEQIPDAFLDHKGAMKVLTNAFVLAEETLAYGGFITVKNVVERDGVLPIGCVLEVVGRNAQLNESFQDALARRVSPEEVTPRTIQPYITACFADHYGMHLEYDQPVPDRLEIKILLTEV